MKKLTALLAAISLLPIVQVSEAKEPVNIESKIDVLEGLNIVDEDILQDITWGSYLSAVEGMMSDEKFDDVVGFASSHSLINDRINTESDITYEDAIKVLVRAGGYTELAPGYSETSAYIRTAGERKLTDGITAAYSDSLTSDTMVMLLYNALDADITDFDFDGSTYKIEAKSDETIISRYRQIYETTDILYDNGDTALDSDMTANRNALLVGNKSIEKNGKYKKDYLGRNVRVFYKDESGDYSLEYLYPEDNRELALSGKDISSTDFSKLYYETDDKLKNVRLDAAIKVIYNGQAYFDYTESDFTADENDITLVDNNDDGIYEVALILSYETIVASYVTKYDGKVVNKYKYTGAVDSLDISSDSNDYKVRYYVDGEQVEKPEIKIWNVLSIATSKGVNPIRSVYISSNSITGTITQTDDDKYIIDEDEYELNSAFSAAKAAGDSAVPEITLGTEYTIYLDIGGRIAAIASSASQQLGYAVMIKMSQDDSDEEIVKVKYMDSVGEWHESYLRKRVKLYDETYDGKSLKASEVFDAVVGDSNRITPQVVQLAENADGEINVLKIAISSQTPIKDKLTVGAAVKACYRWTTKLLGNENDIKLYVADDAIIFLMPNGYSTNENDYGVKVGNLSADKEYTVTPYNTDKFKTSDCLVMNDADGGTRSDNLFIVSHVSKILDSDDNVKTALFGQYGEYENYSIVAKDNATFDGVQRGDVLRIYTNKKNEVVKKENIYSASAGFRSHYEYSYSGVFSGYVKDIDAETKRVLIDCGDYGEVAVMAGEDHYKMNAFLVDRNKKGVEKIEFSDVTKGDFVVATLYFACLDNIIVIK